MSEPETLIEMIQIPRIQTPDKTAIAFVGHDENITSLSYAQLWNHSLSVAHKLISASVKPGDRVLLVNPSNEEL